MSNKCNQSNQSNANSQRVGKSHRVAAWLQQSGLQHALRLKMQGSHLSRKTTKTTYRNVCEQAELEERNKNILPVPSACSLVNSQCS